METDLCALAPKDWSVMSLEAVCQRITSGGTPSRREPAFYEGEGWPWVKTQELHDTWIEDTEERITDDAIANSSAKVLPEKTLLVAMYGATVGQLGILRRSMTCNQACSALVVDQTRADFRFVFYQLLHARSELQSLATGAAQQNLSGTLIKSLKFPYPPLPEQRAIAHILGTLDDKIELNRRRNQTLEAMARALFKDWFVDFGPVHAKMEVREAYLPADLWQLFPDRLDDEGKPEGWRCATPASFASLNPESWTKKNAPHEIRYVDLSNTKQGTIEGAARMPWSEAPSRAQRVLRPGDTIVGTVRPGNKSVALIADEGMTGSTGFAVLRPQEKYFRDFVFLAATSPENIERLSHLADGAAYPAVRPDVVLASPVTVPPGEVVNDVLRGFAKAVSAWVDAVEKNKQESKPSHNSATPCYPS